MLLVLTELNELQNERREGEEVRDGRDVLAVLRVLFDASNELVKSSDSEMEHLRIDWFPQRFQNTST